jgi:superoxide dismutase, Fe-Mn family
MREIIELLEDKEKLEQTALPYGRSALVPVFSKTNIDNHYGKLYKGYVERFNKGEGDSTFNRAGAFLHDKWFTQLRAPKNANSPNGASLALINRHFGNFVDFKRDFKEEAMKKP